MIVITCDRVTNADGTPYETPASSVPRAEHELRLIAAMGTCPGEHAITMFDETVDPARAARARAN